MEVFRELSVIFIRGALSFYGGNVMFIRCTFGVFEKKKIMTQFLVNEHTFVLVKGSSEPCRPLSAVME